MVFEDGIDGSASAYYEKLAEGEGIKESAEDDEPVKTTGVTGTSIKKSAKNINLGSKLFGQFGKLMLTGQEFDKDIKGWLHQYNKDYVFPGLSTEGEPLETATGSYEPGSEYGQKNLMNPATGTMIGNFNQGNSDTAFMDAVAEPLTHAMNASPLALFSKFHPAAKIGMIGALLNIQMGSTTEDTAQSPIVGAFIDKETGEKNALGKLVAPVESPLGTLALWGVLPHMMGKAVGKFRNMDNLAFRMKMAKLVDIPLSMMKNIPANLQRYGSKMQTILKEGFTESMIKDMANPKKGALVHQPQKTVVTGRGEGWVKTKSMSKMDKIFRNFGGDSTTPSMSEAHRKHAKDERTRRALQKKFKEKFMKQTGGKSYIDHGGKQISWKDVYNKTEKGKTYLDDLAKTNTIRGVGSKLSAMKTNAAKWLKGLKNIKPGMVAKGANIPALYAQIMAEQVYMNNLGFDTGSDMEAQDAWNYALGIGGDTGASSALERRSASLGDDERIELAEQVKKLIDSEG